MSDQPRANGPIHPSAGGPAGMAEQSRIDAEHDAGAEPVAPVETTAVLRVRVEPAVEVQSKAAVRLREEGFQAIVLDSRDEAGRFRVLEHPLTDAVVALVKHLNMTPTATTEEECKALFELGFGAVRCSRLNTQSVLLGAYSEIAVRTYFRRTRPAPEGEAQEEEHGREP